MTATLPRTSTVELKPGAVVATTWPDGEDFGLPLVSPTRAVERPGRKGVAWREVRSTLHQAGGTVVRFTDGTKTRPLHGRTAWVVSEEVPA